MDLRNKRLPSIQYPIILKISLKKLLMEEKMIFRLPVGLSIQGKKMNLLQYMMIVQCWFRVNILILIY